MCVVCGSPDVALSDSDSVKAREHLRLTAYDDPPPPVACNECGSPLDEPGDLPAEQRERCPKCGSLSRSFSVKLEGGVQLRGGLALKARGGGKGRPYLEAKHGDDLWRKMGKWMNLSRVVDRRNNRYTETVTDPDTGEVVHHVDEPLSEHIGHGDDRRKRTA